MDAFAAGMALGGPVRVDLPQVRCARDVRVGDPVSMARAPASIATLDAVRTAYYFESSHDAR